MFRMLVESNPYKLTDNGMNIDEFNSLLRNICLDTDFKESSPNHYYLEDSNEAIGRMLVLEAKFRKLGYIIPNLSKWVTYSDEEGEVDELS